MDASQTSTSVSSSRTLVSRTLRMQPGLQAIPFILSSSSTLSTDRLETDSEGSDDEDDKKRKDSDGESEALSPLNAKNLLVLRNPDNGATIYLKGVGQSSPSHPSHSDNSTSFYDHSSIQLERQEIKHLIHSIRPQSVVVELSPYTFDPLSLVTVPENTESKKEGKSSINPLNMGEMFDVARKYGPVTAATMAALSKTKETDSTSSMAQLRDMLVGSSSARAVMTEATEVASSIGARVVLADRSLPVTLSRALTPMSVSQLWEARQALERKASESTPSTPSSSSSSLSSSISSSPSQSPSQPSSDA